MKIKNIFPPLAGIFLAATILSGCQSAKPAISPGNTPAQLAVRNNCYGLLHQLLGEQKDVSLLRFIKREHSDVKVLVKKIASTSGKEEKLLETFAAHDPSIKLDDLQLPPGEAATREAIGATKEKELLGQSGDEFELSLLLTQTEALSYAAHLAQVAGENEPDRERAAALSNISAEMGNLYHDVFSLMLARVKPVAKD